MWRAPVRGDPAGAVTPRVAAARSTHSQQALIEVSIEAMLAGRLHRAKPRAVEPPARAAGGSALRDGAGSRVFVLGSSASSTRVRHLQAVLASRQQATGW